MTWRGAAALALKGLRRRPGRAVLTVLAVALAAALLTALLTIATTAETRVLSEVTQGGPLAGIKVAAASPDPTQVGQDQARPGDPRVLDGAAVARIRSLPGVDEVVPVVAARVVVVPPAAGPGGKALGPFSDTEVGVDITQVPRLPVSVLWGRLPAPTSLTEVAVTEGYLSRYGLDRAQGGQVLGQTLVVGAPQQQTAANAPPRLRWTKATIVGVVAQDASDGQLLVPVEQVQAAREWGALGAPPPAGDPAGSPYNGLYVVADTLDHVATVRTEITAVGYSTSAPENLIASVLRYLRVVELVLTSVGAIALVVAGLGITNAMLAAVRERRREIGVLKAIGARDGDVLRVFLVEAGLLGAVGGLAGAVLGVLVARLVGEVVNGYLTSQGLRGVHPALPLAILAVTVVGSTLLAILAGTVPAIRAARLPAREAVESS